jgi:uncharacterized membrane protein
MEMKTMHPASRIIIILIAGIIIYTLAFSILSLTPVSQASMPSRRPMMGSFSTTNDIILNGVSIALGLTVMLAASFLFFRRHETPKALERDEFSIMKRALKEDETALLERVREVPQGITQDSLRFRLGWSKAKVSTMLSNLDRMGLVQRERFGKTYRVYYQQEDSKSK